MPKSEKPANQPERTGWACNRCNLVMRQARHPGGCRQCGCPEHRMLFDGPPLQKKVEQGNLFNDQD